MEFNLSFRFGKKKAEPAPAPEPAPLQAKVVNEAPQDAAEFQRMMDESIQKVFREFDQKLGESYELKNANSVEMPIEAGRTSIYEGDRYGSLVGNGPVYTNFDFNVLQMLANLSIYNRHISLAVDNIITLGNTDYEIDFGESVGTKQAAEMRKFLWRQMENWYEFSSGEESLDNDLLSQLATYGTISAETIIANDLRSIDNIVMVNPFYIRFAPNKTRTRHIPLQQVGGLASINSNDQFPGYIKLNTNTYHYIAMRRIGEMPYAIPPFVSAIEDIATQNDMVGNFKNMMRRLGMLGFLSVLIKAPTQNTSESVPAYQARLMRYLESLRPGIEKGFSRGIAVGFKETHEFNVEGSSLNSANAENLMKLAKSLIFSAVKQDPNMHGENYSTTETFGRVIMEKMTAQVTNYQKSLATFKSKAFKLALTLGGYKVDVVNVKYNRPSTHDEVREHQVRAAKQANLQKDYQQGLISQEQLANQLGYDKPDQPEPRISPAEKEALKQKATDRKENSLDRIKKKLMSGKPLFDYFVPEESHPLTLVTVGDFPDPEIVKFLEEYIGAIDEQFSKAVDKSLRPIQAELKAMGTGSSLGTVQSTILYQLYSSFENNFVNKIGKIIEDNIEPIYSFYRKDKSVFEDGEGFSGTRSSFFVIPEATFDLLDARAIQFLEEIDNMYLGKFITDPDTERRILRWLQEKFQKGDVPIGPDSTLYTEFIREFADIVVQESWKIRRIIETTVNRSRNIGNVFYLNQAKIVQYQIIEVMDDKTCGWCRHMNNKIFNVKQTVDQYENLFNQGVEKTPQVTPFATTFKLDEFVKMDSKMLRANGVTLPAFHPHCRGRSIGYFKN